MTANSSHADPFTLPAGPERRALMAQLGMNVSPSDFTPHEIAASERDSAAALAELERLGAIARS